MGITNVTFKNKNGQLIFKKINVNVEYGLNYKDHITDKLQKYAKKNNLKLIRWS